MTKSLNLFFPKFDVRLLSPMFGISILGALIAGLYGIAHDQITYTLSEEYFTRFKFDQFAHADFGFPRRIFVAEIGFLATWWVGLIAGWFLARLALPVWPLRVAFGKCAFAFTIMLATAIVAGLVGGLIGALHSADYSYWEEMCGYLHVTDIPAFASVGIIHNAGYLGGAAGLLIALGWLAYERRSAASA